MPNYDEMTRAELIEIIRSLTLVQSELIAKLKKGEQRDSSIKDRQKKLSPTLLNLSELLSENSPLLKWVCDPTDLSCLMVNDAALDYFSYSRNEFLSLKLLNFLPPGSFLLGLESDLVHDVSEANSGTWQYHGKNGKIGFLHVIALHITCEDRPALLMIATDVSKQHQMEFDLMLLREWISYSQIYANFGIWDWDVQNGVTHLSAHISSLFGSEENAIDVISEDFRSAIHPDDRQAVMEVIHAYLDHKEYDIFNRDGFDIQYRIVKSDGAVRWMRERGGVAQCNDGHRPRILAVVNDITEQKHSEQAFRESEENFRLFAENIREVIWIGSPSFDKLFYINNICLEIFGIDKHRFYKGLSNWRKFVYPEDLALVEAAFIKQEQGATVEVETRIIRADGKIRWMRIRSFPVKNGLGERMASGIAEDVTDRRQLEEEHQAHMVQQRTGLVREVHHRIKNNLQGVAGLLRQQANEYPEVSAIIDQAIAQIRAVAVIHGLQGMASDSEVVLCEMVPTIVSAVEAVLSPRIAFDIHVDVPQRIRVQEQETVPLALILNELIMNSAKHAIVESGVSRISISVCWDPVQTQAVIRIINPGVLPKGFDFSAAKGVGIGLELVQSLLPTNGGTLSFVSDHAQVTATLALSTPSIYNV